MLTIPRICAGEREAHVLQIISVSLHPAQAWMERPTGSATERDIQVGDLVRPDDILETGQDTWVALLFLPACKVWLSPATRVRVGTVGPSGPEEFLALKLLEGWLRAQLSDLGLGRQDFLVEAEGVLAAPEGTDFSVARDSEGVTISVFEGIVQVSTPDGESTRVGAGQRVSKQHHGEMERVENIPVGSRREGGEAPPAPPEGEPPVEPDVPHRRPGVRLDPPHQRPSVGRDLPLPIWVPETGKPLDTPGAPNVDSSGNGDASPSFDDTAGTDDAQDLPMDDEEGPNEGGTGGTGMLPPVITIGGPLLINLTEGY